MAKKGFLIRKKKGAIEVQFSWIFVIIVGSLILLFFFSIVKSTNKSSKDQTSIELKEQIDNIFSQVITHVGRTYTVNMPQITLDLSDCNELNIEKSATAGKDTYYKTVFSPDKIAGKELITYSLYWNMPYSVDYFLYLTSNQIRYNFVNNTNCQGSKGCELLLKDIIQNLPANISYTVISDSSQITDNNYFKERFIFFNQTPKSLDTSLNNLEDKDVTAINLANADKYKGQSSYPPGEIIFYKKNNNNFATVNKSAYLGFPMILGAIFSESSIYDCNVKKALLKLEVMSTIYQNRTTYLANTYTNICKDIYQQADITQTLTAAKKRDLSLTEFTKISANAVSFQEYNNAAIIRSCPLLY